MIAPRTITSSLLFCLAAASPAAAQLAPTPRAAGLAGAYVGLARGGDAVDWNPANLGLPDQPPWSVSLPNLALTGAVLGPSLGDLELLTRRNMTDAERQAFLNEVPQTGLSFRGDIQLPWARASLGRFGLGISSAALLDVHAGREMVDLYLEARQNGGVDPQRLDEYGVGDTGFGGTVLTSIAAAYAHPLPFLPFPASVGVAGRAVYGHEVRQGRIYEPVPDPAIGDIRITMLTLGARNGYGLGLDLGAAAQPVPGLTIGLAVENVLNSMSWGDELELRGGEFTGTEMAGMDPQDFRDRFEPRPYDPATDPPEAAELEATLFTGARAPRIVRGGAAFQVGGTAVSVTGSKVTGSGRLYAGWPQYVALGAEQRLLRFWSVRGGAATSLSGATAFALGTTFSMGAAQLTLSAVRASGNPAEAPTGSAGGFDFPDRLAAASGYALMLGLDVMKAPPPPRRTRRR